MTFASPFFLLILWPFILLFSVVTALMEIQIEGGNGWARCLPSWRFAPSWLRKVLNGKDLTGYHVYLNLHLFILFHLPIVLMGWSWTLELTILFLLSTSMLCEDFLWFILNPHFGWPSFASANISWFTRWVGPLPLDYYFWIAVSATLAGLRGVTSEETVPALGSLHPVLQQLTGWGIGFAFTVIALIMIVLVCTPRIKRFLANDVLPHPGHPGMCSVCARKKR